MSSAHCLPRTPLPRRPFARVLSAAAGAAVLLGCGGDSTSATPPAAAYEFRLFATDPGGGTVPLAFRWPSGSLPVRIWIAADDPRRPALIRAIDTWDAALTSSQFRSTLVTSAASADIVVGNSPAGASTSLIRLEGIAEGCFGFTDFDVDPDAGTLQLPFRIQVIGSQGVDQATLLACYDATMLHELGHALGIFAHSPNANDVMHTDPTRATLSGPDQATIAAVYSAPGTLLPVSP